MTSSLIWVPKPGGKCWHSNRTRDLVDLAFTVEVQDDGLVRVSIRCPKSDDENSRARSAIGRVYYKSSEVAKSLIDTVVEEANTKADRKSARDWLLNTMIAVSEDFSPVGGHSLNAGVTIDGKWRTKTDLGLAVIKPVTKVELAADGTCLEVRVEEVTSAYDPSLFIPELEMVAEPITTTPSSGIYKADPSTGTWTARTLPTWDEVSARLKEELEERRAASAMKESIEAVIEAVEPEVKVEETKFISINGKQVQVSWPK